MMNSIFEEFKNAFNRPNNGLIQIILINVAVFVSLGVLLVFSRILGFEEVFTFIEKQFIIPASFDEFITRPWTIITYAFMHSFGSFFHILFNMLVLYWFGKIFVEYLGSDRLVSTYVLGALSGAVLYLLAYNFIPLYADSLSSHPGMVGASGAVMAIVIASATQLPNYTFHLIFLGPVRIKYIAAFYVFASLIGSVGSNAGGNLAHLGGALMGFVYIKSLHGGNDIGLWITQFLEGVQKLFNRKKVRVTYRREEKTYEKSRTYYSPFSGAKKEQGSKSETSTGGQVTQAEIDKILDKISESGYESLSKSEKEKLFSYSKK
jgi:membrane associated rhomboid family serine protease